MRRTIYTIGFLLGIAALAHAQQGDLAGVRVLEEKVTKNGREVDVRMTLDLTGLRVGNQKSVRISPTVVAKEGGREVVLSPVVVDGKTRSRVHRREKALRGTSATDGAYTVVRRRNGRPQQVEYTATLPYESWMAQSRLVLRQEVTGCLECGTDAGTEEAPVRNTFLQLFRPQYATAFVQPAREAVKVRDEVRVARLQFRQDSRTIDPQFKDNAAELDKVTGSIQVVKENRDLTITGIYITGYASPEGSVDYNLKLSKDRADALAAYAQKDTRIDAALWHVTGAGEDWEGLRKEVQKHPKLLRIEDVLAIIDGCDGDKDECERRIRELVPPEIYQRLLNEMYGPLRRNEYKIVYKVKNFNLDEARAQLEKRPDLLSVEEIYMVADSYGKGSADYNRAMITAARTYPANAAAVTNAACVLMGQDDAKGAIALLEGCKAQEAPEVLNALGVAYARDRQYDKAKTVLERAVKAGSTEAKTNLEQLAGVVADL